jgi:hypothetical protein
MTMRHAASAILLLAILVAAPAQAGLFSRPATSVAEIHDTARPMSVAAPDDSMRAVARFMNGKLTVFTGVKGFDFAGGPDAELLWAPDSNALAVTSNDADGARDDGGRFLATILVRQTARKWKRIDLTRRIARLLPGPRGCDDAGPPDVAALGWTSGQRLIVAAARRPEQACGARRVVTAFVVDVPSGDILMSLDERTVKRRYGHLLGKALRERDWRPERMRGEAEAVSAHH